VTRNLLSSHFIGIIVFCLMLLAHDQLLFIEESIQILFIPALLFGLLSFRLIRTPRLLALPKASFPLLGLLGFFILRIRFDQGAAALLLAAWCSFAFVLILFTLKRPLRLLRASYVFFAFVVLTGWLDFFDFRLHNHPDAGISGVFNQKNALGFVLLLAMGLASYYLQSKSTKDRWLGFPLLLSALILIVVIGSKSAMLGVLGMFTWWGFLFLSRKMPVRPRLSVGMRTSLFVLFLLVYPLMWLVVPLIDSSNSSVWSREIIYQATLEMIQQHSIWGVGGGQYGASIGVHWFDYGYRSAMMPPAAHNELLHLTAELGLIGMLLFTSALWFSSASIFQRGHRFSFAWGGTVIGAMASASLDIPVQIMPVPMMLFWGLLAFGARTSIHGSILVSRRSSSVIIAVLLALAIPATWTTIHEFQAERLMKNIQWSGRIQGPSDVQKIQQALDVDPNSDAALFYGAVLMIQNNQIDVANDFLTRLYAHSGDLYPVARKQAQIAFVQGDYDRAMPLAYRQIMRRGPLLEPELVFLLRDCARRRVVP